MLSLNNKLHAYYGNEIDANPYIELNIDAEFYDPLQFNSKYKNTNNPIFASLNAQCFMSKLRSITEILNEFKQNNVPVEILAIQEVWKIPHPDTIYIPNYVFVYEDRKSSKGGGVGFLVHNSVKFKKIPELSTFIENTFESLTIEIVKNRQKTLLTNIYRSPTPPKNITNTCHINNFLNHLDNLLILISTRNSLSYVFLDANINLLNIDRNNFAVEYLNTVHSSSYVQVIDKATRIVGNVSNIHTYSLIDHILFNGTNKKITAGTITYDISDHFMTFIVSEFNTLRNNPRKTFTTRNINTYTLDLFKNYLDKLSWRDVFQSNDVNECLDIFLNHFNTGFNLCFPMKTTRYNKNIHSKNKFMTKGILTSRKTKILLHKEYLMNRNTATLAKYKMYKNIYNSVLKLSKKTVL